MTIDERLKKFKAYFLKNENAMGAEAQKDLREYLDDMDAENFDSIYFTLTDEEKQLIDGTVTGDFEELTQYLVYNKALHRYWDAISGRTSYDGDADVLVLTPKSSALELGISLNVFLKTRSIGIYSIGQLFAVLDKKIPVFTGEELSSIELSIKWMIDDKKVRLEGFNEIQSV